jgi:hypothetical protein
MFWGSQHHAVQGRSTDDVPEEDIASIFRAEE